MTVAWQLCRRHWGAFYALAFWFAAPWLAGVLTGNLTLALPLSWMGGIPFAIYMYRATAASHVLGILPLARLEVWQIACVAGAVAPALVQLAVATVMWVVALLVWPHYGSTHRAGIDMVLLGALYSLAFFQLVLIATASVRRQIVLTATLAIAAMVTLTWFVSASHASRTLTPHRRCCSGLRWYSQSSLCASLECWRFPHRLARRRPVQRSDSLVSPSSTG